jgi:hypothetical protein
MIREFITDEDIRRSYPVMRQLRPHLEENEYVARVRSMLFDWLMDEAKRLGCATLELDSGVQRLRAHAFYFAKRMHISSYHFRIEIR